MKGKAIPYTEAELLWIRGHADWPRAQAHAAFVEKFSRQDVSLVNYISLCKRKGWFRKGERQGLASRLYKPIGTERVRKSGYMDRKIHDDMPLQSRWRAVHLIRWEELNGPVPQGHCLKSLDGDRCNTDPSNWVCVPRAMMPRLVGAWQSIPYDSAPVELKPILLAVAHLDHAAREARNRGKS